MCSQFELNDVMCMFFISDSTLTTDDVTQVMELVNDWNSLSSDLIPDVIIPSSRLIAIQKKYSTKSEISAECASYYVHCNPESSWTHLASCLYYNEEFAAGEKLKSFLPLRGKYQVINYASMHESCASCLYSLCLL